MKRFFCFIIVLLSVSTAFASVIRHRVKPGETIPAIARSYYGDARKDLYIIIVNHIDPRKSLKTGKTILIPFVTIHRVKKRETFRDLAKKYLKDPRKSNALATLNGMDEKKVLVPGTIIRIPFEVFYRVERGDTLGSIAERYLGDKKDAVFLKDYNRLKSLGDIRAGKRLTIPLMAERVKYREEKNIPHIEAKKINPSLYSGDLNGAVAEYNEGEYKASIDRLSGITLKLGETMILRMDMVKIHEYMAFNYIALDETVAAKREFMVILKLDPKFHLNMRDTSPKILSVLDEVRQKQP